MKKLFVFFMFSIVVALGFATQGVKADGEVILYPYDQEACLNAAAECTRTKVGDSHWDVTYNGNIYNVVGGNARYAVDFSDDNSNGMFDSTEIPGNGWASFGGIIVNDTDEEVIIETANRTDLTGAVHRIYTYFDENGKLAMFEDHWVTKHMIFNDGTAEAPDWRLATQTEIDAYNAEVTAETIVDGDPSSDGLTDKATIRIKMDATDTDGYVLEELAGLKWTAAGAADLETVPTDWTTDDWSTVLDYNPNYVVLPAGWTVLGFGTLDRDGSNAKTVELIQSMPAALAEGTEMMTLSYEAQPGWFTGLSALDDDVATDGVNIVVDYNSAFDLDNTVMAKWTNMFDDTTGKIINSVDMLDYSVTIAQDGMDLETIDFVWDGSAYVASAAQTAIDSSMFGSGFTATYAVTTPEGALYESAVDIVVGVFPPAFHGVADRYVNEDEFVDLLEGITADDGYGNDKTDSIMVTTPAGFNMYNPKPGTYQIDLEFTHHVHFDGVESKVDRKGLELPWDGQYNRSEALNTVSGAIMVFTDAATFAAMGSGWGSVMVLVGADGLVDEIFDRYTWDYTTSEGTTVTDGDVFAAWQAAVVIEDGGFVIAAHGSTYGTNFRDENLSYDDAITLTDLVADFDYDIVTNASYMLTVDDTTAPQLFVVNEEYMITAGAYDNVDDAILANVIGFDEFDMQDDLAIYVSANGGLDLAVAGTYAVEVTVEDVAGNMAVAGFDVMVVAPEVTMADVDAVQAAIDALDTLTPAEVQALIDAVTAKADAAQAAADAAKTAADAGKAAADAAQAEIDALDLLTDTDVADAIDAKLLETGCGSSISIGGSIVAVIAVLGGAVLFFVRKPQ